jgi:hypothetical protein
LTPGPSARDIVVERQGMRRASRYVLALGLVLWASAASAVDISGEWAVCFPIAAPFGFCGGFVAKLVGAADGSFTLTTPVCDIHGTVDTVTGQITVPPGECPVGGLQSFTGTATDTSFDANAYFTPCTSFNFIHGVRECPACDVGGACTVGGCGSTVCTRDTAPGCTIYENSGAACDDGVPCTAPDRCVGRECVGFNFTCDDFNPCTDDSCDAQTGECAFIPNSAPCNDNSMCTTGDTCSGGTCVGGPALECAPCERCRPLLGCGIEPLDGCHPSLGKGKIVLRDNPNDVKDKIRWSWGAGSATSSSDFGDPPGGDGYTMCVYDGTPYTRRLLLRTTAPGGGTCAAGTSCWKPRGTPPGAKGFVYKDSKLLLPDGVKRMKLQPGAAGRAKASVIAQGPNAELPSPIDVALPVLVQLHGENGTCLETTFTHAQRDVEGLFQAANSPSAAFLDAPTYDPGAP